MRKTATRLSFCLLLWGAFVYSAHGARIDTISTLAEMNVSGPRIGLSVVVDTGALYQKLHEHDGGRTISQFGWHFEFKTSPLGGGPSLILEIIPLFAGIEYGLFIPSLTLPVGIRFPFGTEFGMGPNFALGGTDDVFHSSIIFAIGHSFSYRGIGIPINLAYAKGPAGQRVSLLVGYAIVRNVRKQTQSIEQ